MPSFFFLEYGKSKKLHSSCAKRRRFVVKSHATFVKILSTSIFFDATTSSYVLLKLKTFKNEDGLLQQRFKDLASRCWAKFLVKRMNILIKSITLQYLLLVPCSATRSDYLDSHIITLKNNVFSTTPLFISNLTSKLGGLFRCHKDFCEYQRIINHILFLQTFRKVQNSKSQKDSCTSFGPVTSKQLNNKRLIGRSY